MDRAIDRLETEYVPSPYQFFDILPSPEGGRDSHLRKWDLPGSLKSALHGTIRVWSHMLLPQALLPASPAVDAESFTPRLTRTSVLYAHVIVKRFGLGSGFTRPLPQTRTRLSSRPLNGAGLPGSMDKAFVYAPDAVVIHPLRSAQWGVSLGQQRKSMFNALLYKKHPALYREKIQAAPPWHYYAIVGALLVVIGALLGRKQGLAFGAAYLWMFLTGRFCLQRLDQTSRERRHVAEMLVTSVLIPPLSIFWRIRGAIKFRVFFL